MRVTKAELIAALQGLPDVADLGLSFSRPPGRSWDMDGAIYTEPGPVTYATITIVVNHEMVAVPECVASTDIEV